MGSEPGAAPAGAAGAAGGEKAGGAAAGEPRRDDLRHAIDAPATRVVVVGGGIAGLVVARECSRPGFEVTVVDAADRVGGSVASIVVDGITVDAGAESFATRGGHVGELIDELGLADLVVQPNPEGAWVRLPSGTVPLPKAGLLGIPSSPLAADVVRAIGWAGAWRAYLDRILPVLTIGQERSLGTLVRKRMGARVLQRLVAPVATGVYSAQPDDLDIAVVAPGLNAALTRQGSLSGAVAELRSNARAGSAVGGLRGGMWMLARALETAVTDRGGRVLTGVGVASVERFDADADADAGAGAPEEGHADVAEPVSAATAVDGDAVTGAEASAQPTQDPRWTVRLGDGRTLPADVVVIAAPAATSLALLSAASAELASLGTLEWPDASSVELVTLVIDDAALDSAPRGTGVLVADLPGTGVTAKAMTHSTAKWAWLADVTAGRHVVRLSYGRAGQASETEGLDDAELRALAVRDASALLNIPISESVVTGFARTTWTNALPYAALGERERIDAVRTAVEGMTGIEVTGSWLTGTGLASVIPDAKEAAQRVRGLRWKELTENL
ncbi:protoporphyrinogen oxidase [Diaminobutyricibacter tongyongensis]|uniref:Coproporphyrinogen III oxidase n=1 Tax=Leifsonia tongyongensis TaxID=1268043 RepID=A0A6L9XVT0_9MICO|nr:protoporphyrinogen oxidase [Diaminobutyricibacter tongyongensis]NEN05540.1 protoporphyrinogen oxidase [Diaminobutyricibacter tongyongensis]